MTPPFDIVIAVPVATLVAIAVGASLASALVSLPADRWPALLKVGAFPLLALSGAASLVAGLLMMSGAEGFSFEAPLGLPWHHWQLRLDPLAGFFVGVIGIVVLAVGFFGPGYTAEYPQKPYSLGLLGFCTGLFICGMQIVVLADDAFSFVIAWELMSVSSYLLVAYEHRESANRSAAFLYLLMAQIGAGLILLAFGVLVAFGDGGFSFAAMRASELTPLWTFIAFGLGAAGFGMKAGLVPLHVWLPEAHPAAPAHISALMSGVMLKVAVYGFIRFVFDLLGPPHWSFGVILVVIGSSTALYGVLYALVQTDLKRTLAYSSIENIGIVFIGLGLSALFFGLGLASLGALGLVAALYHCLNHAVFKSLLFLGAGVVVQGTREHDLDHMGGLIRFLPWTAGFFLVACLSLSGLPPFNGFVSEWLTFQTALQATQLESGVLRAIVPIAGAMLALTGVLAAACFVKVYGIGFLGQPRTPNLRHTREASRGMLVAQGYLALLCVLLGLFPTTVVTGLGLVGSSITGHALPAATRQGWLWLTPVSHTVASYSAPIIFLGIAIALLVWATVWLLLRSTRKKTPVPRVDAWECGYGPLNPRMQYTATAFVMPLREIFRPGIGLQTESARVVDEALVTLPRQIHYSVRIQDLCWRLFYEPVGHWVMTVASLVQRMQTGHLRHYIAYSFFTLVFLLWMVI